MRYSQVCIEGFGYTLPDEVVHSDALEAHLAPLYERLKLPAGRLEFMSGIRERRFWPSNQSITEISALTVQSAIKASKIPREKIGALVHGSVCRDFLEPATACGVHARSGLLKDCLIYDVSNACLGVLNGMVQVSNMIELGHIQAGVVVGTENGRDLVENTIEHLNADETLTRNSIKDYIASLTIGSASVAVVLCHRDLSSTQNRLIAASYSTNTSQHALCQSDGLTTMMRTDSELLMREGIQTGATTFEKFLKETGWNREDIQKAFCHQVGSAHRKQMFQAFGLDDRIDFSTLEFLGNTGAAALPITMAMGIERGWVQSGDHVGMFGIGSGINSMMLGVEWRESGIVEGEQSK